MKTNHFFGWKRFSIGKLVNMSLLASIIITSCGLPAQQSEEKTPQHLGKRLAGWVNYEQPVYNQPKPIVGERPGHAENPNQDSIERSVNNLPVQFVENIGQFDERSLFQAQAGNQTMFITREAIWLTVLEEKKRSNMGGSDNLPVSPFEGSTDETIKGVNLKLSFIASGQVTSINGFSESDTDISFLSADGHSKTNVPVWRGIRYENIYPGHDLEMTGDNGRYSWKFTKNDPTVSPLNEVLILVEGAQSIVVDDGTIIITTEVAHLLLPIPSYAGSPAEEIKVEDDVIVLTFSKAASNSGGKVLASNEHYLSVNFPSGSEDPNINHGKERQRERMKLMPEFVIKDPDLQGFSAEGKMFSADILSSNSLGYITFLEANADISGVVVNSQGNAYIVSTVSSATFPTVPGSYDTTSNGGWDVGVSKLNGDGSNMIYSTYIGGGSGDNGKSIALDAEGNAYITGCTSSTDFPVSSGSSGGGSSTSFVFIAKLSSNGDDLLYSIVIQEESSCGWDITLDSDKNAYVSGVSGYINSGYNFNSKAFVARLNNTGEELEYFTEFGGSGWATGNSIIVTQNGGVYVAGVTNSDDFSPAPSGYDGSLGGTRDGFITMFDDLGQMVNWSYLGGSRNESTDGIAEGTDGNIYVSGGTDSADFPTTANAYDNSYTGYGEWYLDGFVSGYSPDLSALAYSTLIGGLADDRITGLAVGPSGDIFITGYTGGDFPISANAFDTTIGDAAAVTFITRFKIEPSQTIILYSTYSGFNLNWSMPPDISTYQYARDISVDQTDNAYVVGWNYAYFCTDCYTEPSVDPYSGFIIKLDQTGNAVHEASVLNACNVAGECQQASQSNSQGVTLGPINTRTGGLFYQIEDITVPTAAKELIFFRTYSSLATDLYSSTLGYGWTHNLDTRLIFSTDPGGEAGYVLFKAHTANQYRFIDNGDGSYNPDYGVVGSLTLNNSQYLLTYPDQSVYTFSSNGKLLTWSDAQGHLWNYSYNSNGDLEQVNSDSGARYLTLAYDNQGRIASVVDQTGRSIAYTYDANGDLVGATSLIGGSWTYEYDSTHRLTRVIDPNGNTVERTEYDAEGRAIKQWDGNDNLLGTLVYNADGTTTITDSLGNVETHTYDDRLTLVLDEDGAGGETQKTYDGNFRPTTITDAGNAATNLVWSEDGANLTKVIDAEGGQTDITYDSLNNPTSVIDPLGYLTTYEYDGTLLTSTTNALNQETIYTYTPEGFVESVTDALGNTTSFTYDSYGQRTSMTDALGNTWTYAYDSLGRLTDATDPLGRVSHSEYDLAGRLIRSTRNYDPGKSQNEDNLWNIVTEYGYDLSGNQTSVTDTFGRVSQYQYDAAGQLVKVIDPNGNEATNTYNSAGQLVSTTDALGHVTTYTYDAAGRLVSTVDALNGTTSTIYNPDGTVASTTDALGRAASYTYDDLKRVLTVTQPNGAVTTNAYDANGNLTATTDALANTTHYEYDALGRVIKTIDPFGNFTESFYDDAGRLVQTKDARGNATTYAYDSAGRQLSVTDALGNITSYEYDNLGRRTAVIDAAGNRTEYSYDALDRVVAVTDPLGNTVTTEYDALGQVIRRTDANGNDVAFSYNNLGQTVSQTDALGNTTSFAYDALGNRVSVTNARGAITSVTYDALNRPVVTTDPLGYISTTTYDIGGQVSASTNANNETTSFGYNSLGQQATVTDPLGHVTQYQYDSLGRMTLMTDANGVSIAYEYDALGRLAAVTENYKPGFQPDGEVNVHTEYTYDANGNRLTIKDGNGNITTFTYDALNRLSTETDPLGNTWSYVYDELGRRVSMTDANGDTTLYEYDDASRLTNIDYVDDNDVSFTYDAGGRRATMSDPNGTTSWAYDNLNRATAITDSFGTTVSYVYDSVGNLERMLYPSKDISYSYDANNRLTQVGDWTKNTNYQYDPLGRVTAVLRSNGVDSAYTYDAAGRLIQLTHGNTEEQIASFQYAYDNTGNRVQAVERVKNAGAGPTVHLTVADTTGALMPNIEVYAFDGNTYTGYHAQTDVNGQVAITLPSGSYRFRVDVDGTQYWSGTDNHCAIGQCDNLLVTVTTPVLVYVADSYGTPQANIPVYAFIGTQYTGFHATSGDDGFLAMRLPEGAYTFRADFGGTQFWSADVCSVPGCGWVNMTVNQPVTVTVLDNIGMPHAGIEVYAFDGTTYTNKHATTDESGQVKLTLLNGNYRFRADFNGTQFWSGTENHCSMPGCSEATVTITLPLVVTVMDSGGAPQQGISVYAFDGTTYTGYHGTTDIDGRVTFTLPQGNYRFRADLRGTQFWSDTQNHCTVPDCSGAQITITNSTTVTVVDTENTPKAGVNVYAFNGTTYTGYHGTTDSNGQVNLTLPQGSYRFRADLNGTQFWSGASNHCDVPGCTTASVTVTNGVLVTVTDTDGAPKAGIKVYAFNGTTYTGYNATTNASGQVTMTLPVGSYRFRADFNGTQFWSGASNHCDVPGCGTASVTVTNPITVTVTDTDGTPKSGLKVYAFNGTTYTGYNATTNASGQVTLTLPLGSYRFRADYGGSQYWSGAGNHCDIPGCSSAAVTVSIPLTITVQTADGTPQTGIKVYAFTHSGTGNGTTYTGYNATTNASGQVTMALPLGSYRFRADYGGSQYWSGAGNHCDIPGCLSLTVVVGPQPTATATSTPSATPTATETPPPPTTTPGATETASPTPEATPTETPAGSGYQPGLVMISNPAHGHLLSSQFKPLSAPPNDVTVTVLDVDSTPKEGLNVYVFDETAYTGFNGATDANGQITFTLPDGNYRFRADLNGTQFWSGETNHCVVPGCDSVNITVTKPILITVQDSASTLKEGLNVYAFDGATYTGYHSVTDSNGQASLTLPQGNYRFRADFNGTQFWSGETNHCDVNACENASIMVSLPMTLTVLDSDSMPKEGLNVYAFDGANYTGYHLVTDANGQVTFTLPFGFYRFRADLNGTQFWSGTENHCDLNNVCDPATIMVTKPLTVTVADELNTPYADLPVYAFDETAYTGYHGTTDANGQVTLTLPAGNYRFRADLRGTQYWSATENTCSLPGCESASVTIPGGFEYSEVTINYDYDSLYRLTNADYSTGDAYQYTYDAVGNRLTQEGMVNGLSSIVNYQYDTANRLVDVNGVAYTWDMNGNLLSDGVKTYTYDSANRLTSVDDGNSGGAEYTYNGLGDRLSETAPTYPGSPLWETTYYTLDLNTGLTQVLSDGTTTYTYGLGRITQQSGMTPEYFLGDALGSVRQMTDQAGGITFARNYDPYGVVTYTGGTSQTEFGFTGEQYGDSTQLLYLRARYYNPTDGRFQSRDTWGGDGMSPLSYNKWQYVYSNPINYTDPTGMAPFDPPCILNAGETGLRYCIFDKAPYKGAFIDTKHFKGGKKMGEDLEKDLNDIERFGRDDYPMPVKQDIFLWFRYTLEYKTSIPADGLSESERKQTAYGVFMDYQIRFETAQGIDPRCDSEWLNQAWPHCSSFSNEDLVSDYLGFVSAMEDISFFMIIHQLGGGHASSEPPYGQYPKNHKFTSFLKPAFDACGDVPFVRQPLPRSLILYYSPLPPGGFWDVPDGYTPIDLTPYY